MKIGRNQPCPCGSGKKYKKCCLIRNKQSSHSNLPLAEGTDFPHIMPIAEKIYERIKDYDFQDLIVATFCLNSWRRNRSALAQALTLHLALSMDKPFGSLCIKEYADFQSFFSKISDLLPVTVMEDYIIDDYGEVFINHNGTIYPIIIGTGYLQVYSMVRYLQTLARVRNVEDEFCSILEYSKTIIELTKETNIPNADQEIVYELPSEEFWMTIKALFENKIFQKQAQVVSRILGDCDAPIERKSFVKRNDAYYPLLNYGMLADYYKMLLSSASESERHDHIIETIHHLLENTFNLSENPPNRVLINPKIMSNDLKSKIVDKGVIFATGTKKNIIIALDQSEFPKKSTFVDTINKIEQELSKDELCIIEPYLRDPTKGHCGLKLSTSAEIVFILVEPFTDIVSHASWLEDRTEKWFNCTAIDLLYFIGFSENFDEFVSFIHSDYSDETQLISIGGKSTHFFSWKLSNRNIVSGAIEPAMIHLDFNETEKSTYEFFADTMREFPKTGKGVFQDPLNWAAKEDALGYVNLHHKGCYGFGGNIKRLNGDTYVFLAHNVEFFTEKDFEHNEHTAIKTIEELNQRLFDRYADQLCEFDVLKGKTIQVLFMPWDYANSKFAGGFVSDSSRNIVFSDEYVDKDTVIIRYTLKAEQLLSEIQHSSGRVVENLYFKELLLPLEKYDSEKFKLLQEKLLEDSSLKKTVGVFQIEQPYYFSDRAIDTDISEVSLTKVRKEIAKICLESGTVPGEYKGQDATNVVRTMQISLVSFFEQTISKFDKMDLHYQALNYYAIQQNGIFLNAKRYNAFTDLDESVQHEFEEKTRSTREEYRRNAGTITYLLESNLFVKHIDTTQKCSKEDFNYLLAFADWLVVLQDDADMCHFNDPNFTISVDMDYKVTPVLSDEIQMQYGNLLLRKYNTTDYHIKSDTIDESFLKQSAEAFKKDIGVDLGLVLTLVEYMQLGITQDGVAKEVYTNVFAVKKDELEKVFFDLLEEKKYTLNDVTKALDFLIIDPTLLKTISGSAPHDVLPIWEREKRDNRFSVKPIILDEEYCIFSPVIMNQVLSLWRSGITEWYLPYEIGLKNLKSVLKKWKKRYEDEMVQDIAALFRANSEYAVYPEVELFKRFPDDEYPEELGDYDVIVINTSRKEIWLIESKVLQKVGSIYEDQMQQKSFFFQHKDDEKFQRRIDYVKENSGKVLKSFGITSTDYSVVSYMVTNKLFESRYKEISFPIITFSELEDMIASGSR
jgi:hypothetical protein